jgi:DNA-binding MarR family transcriptional regulator
VNAEAKRELQALEAIAGDEHITQRRLATELGIALGLTNLYLKRLVRKGYVKCINLKSNRIRYLITPTGLAEKTRLAYEFVEYSMSLYGNVRQHLRRVLAPLASGERKRVAIYGCGEAAELAYISILELGLDLVAVFDENPNGTFLGHPVLGVREHQSTPFDVLVVATFEAAEPVRQWLLELGVQPGALVTLRRDEPAANRSTSRQRRITAAR